MVWRVNDVMIRLSNKTLDFLTGVYSYDKRKRIIDKEVKIE